MINTDSEWKILDIDIRSSKNKPQKCNHCGKNHNTARCSRNISNSTCFICGESSHLSDTHLFCHICLLLDHRTSKCPYKSRSKRHCNFCGFRGHWKEICPCSWRQYHLKNMSKSYNYNNINENDFINSKLEKTKLLCCYNCGYIGHDGYTCSKKRMNNFVPNNTLFIRYKDESPYDVKNIEHHNFYNFDNNPIFNINSYPCYQGKSSRMFFAQNKVQFINKTMGNIPLYQNYMDNNIARAETFDNHNQDTINQLNIAKVKCFNEEERAKFCYSSTRGLNHNSITEENPYSFNLTSDYLKDRYAKADNIINPFNINKYLYLDSKCLKADNNYNLCHKNDAKINHRNKLQYPKEYMPKCNRDLSEKSFKRYFEIDAHSSVTNTKLIKFDNNINTTIGNVESCQITHQTLPIPIFKSHIENFYKNDDENNKIFNPTPQNSNLEVKNNRITFNNGLPYKNDVNKNTLFNPNHKCKSSLQSIILCQDTKSSSTMYSSIPILSKTFQNNSKQCLFNSNNYNYNGFIFKKPNKAVIPQKNKSFNWSKSQTLKLSDSPTVKVSTLTDVQNYLQKRNFLDDIAKNTLPTWD